MHAAQPYKAPSTATLARQANLDKRNQKIRDAFYTRFTLQPKPKKYTREYIVSQLAEEYNLSMATIERLVLPKAK